MKVLEDGVLCSSYLSDPLVQVSYGLVNTDGFQALIGTSSQPVSFDASTRIVSINPVTGIGGPYAYTATASLTVNTVSVATWTHAWTLEILEEQSVVESEVPEENVEEGVGVEASLDN